MREILFRGKLKRKAEWHKSEWVYGGVVNVDGTYKIVENTKHNICYYEVIQETIGQFTGLTDKNGVKIFEGDITRHINHKTEGVWKFSEYFSCFLMEEFEVNESHHFYFKIDEPSLEVIGNIHDKEV